jgi:hypothetical protein
LHAGTTDSVGKLSDILDLPLLGASDLTSSPSSRPAGRNLTATTGTGRTCCATGNTLSSASRSWTLPAPITQLVPSETSFVLLTALGEVYTLGDPRHSLGRIPTAETPADAPSIVTALEGLRIIKIAAGGFAGAAVDEAGGCYIWGSPSPSNPSGGGGGDDDGGDAWLPEPGEVALVDLGGGGDEDVVDVAVGAGHIVLLTAQGEVWAAGRGESSQTGFGTGHTSESGWRRWEKPWTGRAKAVFSGPSAWCSVVLVEREDG